MRQKAIQFLRVTYVHLYLSRKAVIEKCVPLCQNGRGPFLTSPLGANFHPRGEVVPQG
jgi:hypothetical protein